MKSSLLLRLQYQIGSQILSHQTIDILTDLHCGFALIFLRLDDFEQMQMDICGF